MPTSVTDIKLKRTQKALVFLKSVNYPEIIWENSKFFNIAAVTQVI